MNLIYKIVLPMVFLGLVSCSTLDADQEDSTIPALPADFNAKVYLEINPDILLPTIKDDVARHNRKQVFDVATLKAVDDSTFSLDTTTVMWLVETFKRSELNNLLSISGDSLKYVCQTNCVKSFINIVKGYNYQKESNDMAKYKAVLESIDSVALAEYHYRNAGRFSGYPYKYCGADKGAKRNTTKTDPNKADFQVKISNTNSGDLIFDFSAKTFCYDVTENDFFLNKEQN